MLVSRYRVAIRISDMVGQVLVVMRVVIRGEGRGLSAAGCVYPTIKFLSNQITFITQMHNNIINRGSYRGSLRVN